MCLLVLKNVKENTKIIGDLLGESYDVCDQMIKCTLFNEHDINNKNNNNNQTSPNTFVEAFFRVWCEMHYNRSRYAIHGYIVSSLYM